MHWVLSITIRNEPGELSRIVGLFSACGINIESIAGGSAIDDEYRRLTVVANGERKPIERIVRSCSRLMLVSRVQDLSERRHIQRELALVDVTTPHPDASRNVVELANASGATVLETSAGRVLLQTVDEPHKLDQFVERLQSIGLQDLARSGPVALASPTGLERSHDHRDMPPLVL